MTNSNLPCGTEVMGLLDEERAVVARMREGATVRQKEAERRMTEERQTQLAGMQQLSRHNAELEEEVKVRT